jgi:hypothetical protein
MRRAGIVISVVAALGLSLAAPAMAYPVPPPDVTCHLDSVQVGGSVGLSGHNWLPNSTVALTFQSDPVSLGNAETNDNGAFSTTVQIPSDATAGTHHIIGTGFDQNGEAATDDCSIVVTGGAGGPGGGVAFTGTNVSLGLVVLAILVAAGLGFLEAGRRRKAHADR